MMSRWFFCGAAAMVVPRARAVFLARGLFSLLASARPARAYYEACALRRDVLGSMGELAFFRDQGAPLEALGAIPIGTLRRDATRTHAACRMRVRGQVRRVLRVDVHPVALEVAAFHGYARFLLYHEYVHSLGFYRHDKAFRTVEALWDGIDASARHQGAEFADFLAARRKVWLWVCPACQRRHLRSRRQNGRFSCANPRHARGVRLVDLPNPAFAAAGQA